MKKNNSIPFVALDKQWQQEKSQLIKIIEKSISRGMWVGGRDVKEFENNIKKTINTKYVVALNSGTDALTLGLKLLNVKRDSEVITVPNSFIASTGAIVHVGAKPIFVDVLPDQSMDYRQIEKKISPLTKAIMPVHLTGSINNMDKIVKISKKYKIPIIEDSAQAIGSKFNNKYAGTFGEIGCFSAHPLKNLNAIGDSGFLVTNNKYIYQKAKLFSNHGMTDRNHTKFFGYNSRMDTLQASILNFRLKNLKKLILQRRHNAELYMKLLDRKNVFFDNERFNQYNTYHLFVIQVKKRDQLKKYLEKNGVNTKIHYPVPIHLQEASIFLNYKKGDFPETEKQSKTILSLPIHQFLKKSDIFKICNLINSFFKKGIN